MPMGNHDFHEIPVSTVSVNRTLTSMKHITETQLIRVALATSEASAGSEPMAGKAGYIHDTQPQVRTGVTGAA